MYRKYDIKTPVLVKSQYLAIVLSSKYTTNSESMKKIEQSAKLKKFKEGSEIIYQSQ